jgi:hypothetical protein
MRKIIIWDRGGTRARVRHDATGREYLWAAMVLFAVAIVLCVVYGRCI